MLDPNRLTPATDTADPTRAKFRSESELPRCPRPRTDIENTDPYRARPMTVTADPRRAKLRNESELPSCKKSRTDKLDPT